MIRWSESSKLIGMYGRRLLSSERCSSSPEDIKESVETVVKIIRSESTNNLKSALDSSGVFLSNDVIDQVLKRFRFGHCNPLQALDFYKCTADREGFYHSQYSLDTLLYILGRNRKFDQVWDVLFDTKMKDRTLISTRTVMVVLARIAKVCSVKMTVEAFLKFKTFIPDFDTDCFNALLRTLCQEKSMTDARNVYHALKRDFKPNIITFNILLSGWKTPESAEQFFEDMKGMKIEPTVVTYNSLVDTYSKSGMTEKVKELMYEMRKKNLLPDVFTYTSLIGSYGLAGQPDKARKVLKEMKEDGVYPDTPAYNATIKNFCFAKRLDDAYSLVEEMESKGLIPNRTTYSLFFRVFYMWNDLGSSWFMYQKMRKAGCLPNSHTCMLLIRLFKRQEKVEMALTLWEDMIENGFGAVASVSDVLLDMLCDLGKLVEAERCFMQMIDKGHRPSHVSFRRIKVLMELANMEDNIHNMTQKMALFGQPRPPHRIQLLQKEENDIF